MALRATLLICSFLAASMVGSQEIESAGDDRSAQTGVVFRVVLDDQPITPATVRFLFRAIDEAEEAKAECIVVELNTPGGVLKSTQELVVKILASEVPVVVYVSPSGGRAASAGVFITLASHVAAMAPGTRIGAAHPVTVGGNPFAPPPTPATEPDPSDQNEGGSAADGSSSRRLSAAEEKLVNDTVAWSKSLAKLRDRNQQWAERAVKESDVLMAAEALEQQVVDFVAPNLEALLRQIDGRAIQLAGRTGSTEVVHLHTSGAVVRTIEMWWGEKLLATISNPNVAILLLFFGVYGILFEFYSPGWGVAGTLGIISLILGFFSLSVLPVNYSGLALILIALAMFVAEAFITSYGALAIGGVICLILGGTMLVDSPGGFMYVSLEIVIPLAISTALITVFLVSQIVKTHRNKVQTGAESMTGTDAVAQDDFCSEADGYAGQVQTHGEYWRARSPHKITKGQHVRVTGRQGLTLLVDRNGSQSVGSDPTVATNPVDPRINLNPGERLT